MYKADKVIDSFGSGVGLFTFTNHLMSNKIETKPSDLKDNLEELAALHLSTMMNVYQKEEGTKNQCLTNVQYLYSSVRKSFPGSDIKVVPACVICTSPIDGSTKLNAGHVVVMINNKIFDPSYEVISQSPHRYMLDIKEVGHAVKDFDVEKKRLIIRTWLEFTCYAQQMNSNPPYPLISNEEYYYAQSAFVDELIKEYK